MISGKRVRLLALTLAVALAGGLALSETGQAQETLSGAAPRGQLRLAGSVQPAKGVPRLTIVQLKGDPAVGAPVALAAHTGGDGARSEAARGSRETVARTLEARQDELLAQVGALGSKVYNYRYGFNGFAAYLTPEQRARLKASGEVLGVWDDEIRHLHTTDSPRSLGLLDTDGGLRTALSLTGDGVVIGVIDSGIAPEHPSFSDRIVSQPPRFCSLAWSQNSVLGRWLCRIAGKVREQVVFHKPADWNGQCQSGEKFTAADCNGKLIGARYYADGFLAGHQMDDGEFLSPRDADGHGTHAASIAAGDEVEGRLFGASVGKASGMAPGAHIAVYKACWLEPGATRASCSVADLARAIDDAVADGVDIINYSIGSSTSTLNAPDGLALLAANNAGVFVAAAAGNDGPDPGTVGAPASAPWVMAVGAATRKGRHFDPVMEVTAPDNARARYIMREASFTRPLAETGPVTGTLVLVDDGVDVLPDGSPGVTYDACEPIANTGELADKVALLQRGGCTFQEKLTRVEAAGAAAAVVFNNQDGLVVMSGQQGAVTIPAIAIGTADGTRLRDLINAGETVAVRLQSGLLSSQAESGDVMGDFSSRGPAPEAPDFIKPDIVAPGVNIFGANTPDVANGLRGQLFQYLSGTSMSTPHVAGIAALLLQAHPDWSPAELRSAMETTAYQHVVREDGETPATPFDFGSGHVNPNRAVDPGLVYRTGPDDYAAYDCGRTQPNHSQQDCEALAAAGHSFDAVDLNLPTVGISRLVGSRSVTRTVTNLGPPERYQAQVEAPPGFHLEVIPPSLNLGTGQQASFTVTATRDSAPLGDWSFGSFSWAGPQHTVRSPVAVRPEALSAPGQVAGSGVKGTLQFDVRFGYTGAYSARPHGLRPPLVIDGQVDDDPSNQFTFRFDHGVTLHLVDIPADQIYSRFSLFDALTDGQDDLDLYLYYCPDNQCIQVGQSGSFTSNEEINLVEPPAGLYAVLVHGYETDQVSGGPGARYQLLAWSLGLNDDQGNMTVTAPASASSGDTLPVQLAWQDLETQTRYLGAVSHRTADGLEALTVVVIDTLQSN